MSTVLVIDDDPLIREVLRILLTRAGHLVALAGDGAEGIERLHAMPADLMILDVRMPVLDGFGVLAHVRARCVGLPVLMLTAEPHSGARAVEAGADAYMRKPFVNDELLGCVERLIAGAG